MAEFNRSMVEMFEDCPRAFTKEQEARKVRGLGRSSGPALRGRVEHAVLHKYVTHLVEAKRDTDLAELNRIIVQEIAIEPGVTGEQRDEIQKDMECFAEKFLPETDGLLAMEHALRVQVTVEGDVVYGTPDVVRVVGDVAYLDDYKSNWQPWTQAEAEKAFQLRGCYAVLVAEAYGVTTVHCRFVFIKSGIERKWVMGADELLESKKALAAKIAAVKACTDFSARPGARCNFCQHAEGCTVREELACGSATEAQRIAGAVMVLEQKVKARMRVLKAFVDEHGPVTVNGETFEYKTSRSMSYDPAAFIEILGPTAAAGYMSVPSGKVKSKKFKDAHGDDLKKYEVWKPSSRFCHGKEK